jgi:hypothetical protein
VYRTGTGIVLSDVKEIMEEKNLSAATFALSR